MEKYDFSGYATRNDLRCSDGRTIRAGAFAHNDGAMVPLVWNHSHNDPGNVLGHAILKNRKDGVYCYGVFNDTEAGQNAKDLVAHRDVTHLSIYANHLQQRGGDVLHGDIREVSLVLAGANPGAYIDSVMVHGDLSDEDAVIYTNDEISLWHSEEKAEEEVVEEEPAEEKKEEPVEEAKEEPTEEFIVHADGASEKSDDKKESADMPNEEKTVQDVIDTMNEEQKTVMYALVGQALEDAGVDLDEEEEEVKHNVFEADEMYEDNYLSHADEEAIFMDAKRLGSMKEAALEHGITNIDYLFPDAKNINNVPDWIKRDTDWVAGVMADTHHTPFSRIKSMHANITADEARALGYIKGHLKKEEVFSLLKRTTTPQTVYKKQKLDRDDVIDITDFDVVAWIKGEMRIMLDEELARAFLIGDGRLASSDDKIQETNIRPIYNDSDLYTIKVSVNAGSTDDDKAKNFIRAAIKARKDYKGSGNPALYTTEDMLTDMLLLTDNQGRDLYDSEEKLRTKLRVSKIVTVPVMENQTGANGGDLLGIIVNLKDYTVGADKGGAVNMFDDFDIDYNRQKYLIETRCSGALTKPYSAIALETATAGNSAPEPQG